MRSTPLARLLLLAVGAANAKDPPAANAAAITAAGIPICEKAVFVIASREAGYRFATNPPPAAVTQRYRPKLADSVLFDEYSALHLHKDRKGPNLPDVIGKRRMSRSPRTKRWSAGTHSART